MLTAKKAWLPFVAYPLVVGVPDTVKFRKVSCGSHHTVAVTTSGDIYACGLTTRGRIGLSQDQIRNILKVEDEETPVNNIYELIRVPVAPDAQGRRYEIS